MHDPLPLWLGMLLLFGACVGVGLYWCVILWAGFRNHQ